MNIQIILVFNILYCTSFIAAKVYDNPNAHRESDHYFWYNQGKSDIKEALNRKEYNHVAKNIILFLGDGMGVTVNTAGRIYKGQRKGHSGEEYVLSWEKFPHLALMKTYNIDSQVPDSAATATAFLGGVKANFLTIGLTSKVTKDDCPGSLDEANRVDSVLQWAQEVGKDTGFVTTTRVTHATPASLYAHSAYRFWECDTKLLKANVSTDGCKDIARQLVEDEPGKNIDLILAGGRGYLGVPLDDDTDVGCNRTDGLDLVKMWGDDKDARGASYKYVTSGSELDQLDIVGTDYIMGLFAGNAMPKEYKRKSEKLDSPSIKEMTQAAIKRLSRNKKGFFLMVEGGQIDSPLHDNQPHIALEQLSAMDDAVEAAMEMVDLSETLVIVTADHSHTMTINGYPERGNDILGTSTYENTVDKNPHSTLMFTTGKNSNLTDLYYDPDTGKVVRPDLTDVDTTSDPEFIFPSYLQTGEGHETHGGEDVAAFAAGPMSHLFHRVHEQTYVAHVMAYAACMGPFKDDCAPQRYEEDEKDSYYQIQSNANVFSPNQSAIICMLYWQFLQRFLLK